MLTIEFIVSFKKPIGEFTLNMVGELGYYYRYSEDLMNIHIETELTEDEFLEEISTLIDVEDIGLIKHIRTLEPDWLGLNNEEKNNLPLWSNGACNT